MDGDDRTLSRRDLLLAAAAGAGALALQGCEPARTPRRRVARAVVDPVLEVRPLGARWATVDPFLFCAHHDDAYPAGNERLGPAASLAGRVIGRDFAGIDGYRMYHGEVVPGFPQHPHRGFETVTVVRRGLVDHSDSLGAKARYGGGDAQWLTAGAGIVHAEMFPLLDREEPNALELFQIWLNLPREAKFAPPHFSMLWREAIPTHVAVDDEGRRTRVTVVAGALGDARAPAPPPSSWASRPESGVAIWTIAMDAGARFVLPDAAPGVNRTLYAFRGGSIELGGRALGAGAFARLVPDVAVPIANGARESELLLLEGRPIGEPVVARGPFVMCSGAEIAQAYADYRRTGFGGWPHPSDEPVHPAEAGRFAAHADGRVERAG